MMRRFNIIGILVVILPLLTFAYIIHRSDVLLDTSQYILFAMALLLILAGLSILRYIFDIIYTMIDFIKKADKGNDSVSAAIEKDVSDLSKISALFGNLMGRFEKATDELNQRIIELNAIKEMTEVARHIMHVDELLKLVLNKAMQAIEVKCGSVFLVDPADPERFHFVASKPENIMEDGDQEHNDYSLIKSVLSDGKTLIIQDIENDPRTHKTNNPKYGAPSFISMPIYSQGRIIAVLNLSNKEKGGLFTESDERILSIMLGEIGFALENAMLHLKVKEQLAEIKKQNIKLELEVQERMRADDNLRKANEELYESNKSLAKAYALMRDSRDQLKNTEELGFIVDREGVIQSITERMPGFTNKSRAELIGENFLALLDDTTLDDFKNELRNAWMGITCHVSVKIPSFSDSEKSLKATLTRLTSAAKQEMLISLK
jgi:hypothetical protein